MKLATPSARNKKGFTLVELMVIIMIAATLAVAGMVSLVGTNRALSFKQTYENIMASVRSAKSMAVTNKDPNGASIPTRYGVELMPKSVKVFADNGTLPYRIDGSDEILEQYEADFLNDAHSVVEAPLVFGDDGTGLTIPIYLYFDPSTADMTIYEDTLNLVTDRCVVFEVTHDDFPDKFQKFFIIFKAAGIIEPFNSEPSC